MTKSSDQDPKIDSAGAKEEFEYDYQMATSASFTDSLTGLFNHGFFQISLEREIERYKRYGSSFALAFIDVDSFFFYNHRHGAMQGDRALKKIADLIQSSIRKTDLAARYAGDVFAVIFAETDAERAFKPLERIRTMVEQQEGPPLTVSVGITSYPREAKTRESIVQKTNVALKEAKLRGKNSIYFFGGEETSIDSAQPIVLIVDDDPRNLKLLEGLRPECVSQRSGNPTHLHKEARRQTVFRRIEPGDRPLLYFV